MSTEQITLYRFKPSPFGHKVDLALIEANIPYRICEVDLFNKPEWFTSKVNPAGKFPAITYGPADTDPTNPPQSAFKLAESGVILEFIADLYPESGLLPKDPIARAKVRFLNETVTSKLVTQWAAFLRGEGPMDDVLKAVEAVQDLLPDAAGKFAVGDTYTIADATLIPFIVRLTITYKNDIGKFSAGEGHRLGAELQKPQYAKFMQYSHSMLERQSTKDTYDEEEILSIWRKFFSKN
ncbi:glutathione S-transferase [Hygrophoropsis aurantiaca]|uniref:Glutathione S-transferase n=1 Tax=Hygrophoropsis aurantiaca TaxID=72124 RepID=A0ACB8A856_9AGAM|nr:glutathione S-transferase [Hygrophoropsis aurantiaca]